MPLLALHVVGQVRLAHDVDAAQFVARGGPVVGSKHRASALDARFLVGVEEHAQHLKAGVFENLLGAAAEHHAGPLLGELDDGLALVGEDGVLVVIGDGADGLEEGADLGDALLVVLHEPLLDAALLGGVLDDVLVVNLDAELLGQRASYRVAACRELAVDGDDLHGLLRLTWKMMLHCADYTHCKVSRAGTGNKKRPRDCPAALGGAL